MKLTEIEAAIEAALFAAGDAVPAGQLAAAVGLDAKTLRAVVARLKDAMARDNRGIEIADVDDAYQLRTRAAFYPYAQALFAHPARRPLTPPLLETLAIVAYRQPVTKSQIEEIRGVDATHAVNRLAELGLVVERGRSDLPGRPILFGTSDDFLRFYGLPSLNDLPRLPEAEPGLQPVLA